MEGHMKMKWKLDLTCYHPPAPPPPVSGMCADNRGYLLSERGQDGYPSFVFGGLNLTGSWRRNWRGKETAKLVTIIVLINVRSLP